MRIPWVTLGEEGPLLREQLVEVIRPLRGQKTQQVPQSCHIHWFIGRETLAEDSKPWRSYVLRFTINSELLPLCGGATASWDKPAPAIVQQEPQRISMVHTVQTSKIWSFETQPPA